jgi:hypothetical protein
MSMMNTASRGQMEHALRARLARLLEMMWLPATTDVKPTFTFGEGLESELAKVSLTLGTRDWVGVFRRQLSDGNAGDQWELCSFDPLARAPSVVHSPPVHLVSRLQRSKMILRSEVRASHIPA